LLGLDQRSGVEVAHVAIDIFVARHKAPHPVRGRELRHVLEREREVVGGVVLEVKEDSGADRDFGFVGRSVRPC
jgi:hypothetical protein